MKKLLLFLLGAAIMELLAMEVKMFHLPPSASIYFGSAAAVLVFLALWEKPNPDERDRMISWRSSHYAFLSVTTVLSGILIYQTLSHVVEPWTILSIMALAAGKFIGRWVEEKK